MDPKQLFFDDRFRDVCAFCGGAADTNDHIPSKVLLDQPYPDDLPGVEACFDCNNGFSLDEEYLACFVECVICGTTDPAVLRRPKVQAIMRRKPALAAMIEASRREQDGRMIWVPENDRVRNVILKLARGHTNYAYSTQQTEEPAHVVFLPLESLSPEQRETFESMPESDGLAAYPELGSRAFANLFVVNDKVFDIEAGWSILQPGRYRFALPNSDASAVRIVLSEYLACEVLW